TDLSGNLPQAPVNHIAIGAAGHLYVATDQGVFVSDSNGRWSRYGRGLPLSPIDDISYDATNHRITAATFGRGFYQIPAS
ncbi:MAG: glycosyl hydrolase, partial [Sciscionella sp.]|nr:glycosyl hydrolase [Sciscionella sp.]